MPAFVYGGDTTPNNIGHELWRVEVFTDSDCLNAVFRGPVVGSPAYVPRDSGPLAMPAGVGSEKEAWDDFLATGTEPDGVTADGELFKTNELDVLQGSTAAKVDLWDNSWPGGRYYWTIMAVDAVPESGIAAQLAGPAVPGATAIGLTDATGIGIGDPLFVGPAPGEHAVVESISGNTVNLVSGLKNVHVAGEPVLRPSGGLTYRDAELAQDACASGRVLTFGKSTQPAVTGQSTTPFASGLSPTGKLVAASKKTPKFFGTPLVAWLPTRSTDAYQVQWSRSRYPWRAAGSLFTYSTAVTLPLTPGTWWYRVRGLDFLMTGSRPELSWSTPVRLVVTKPRFRIVH
jgi:hypothetical protein